MKMGFGATHKHSQVISRREAQRRTEALMHDTLLAAAQKVREEVEKNAPRGGGIWSKYRASLEVVQIAGVGKGRVGYLVRAAPLPRVVRPPDAADTILLVHVPRKQLFRYDKRFLVLEKFNPWTLDTLPVDPRGVRGLRVYSRKVRPKEARAVAELRQSQRRMWAARLVRLGWSAKDDFGAGVREMQDKARRSEPAIRTQADLAFEVARIERGLSSTGYKPHWGPALRVGRELVRKQGKAGRPARILDSPKARDTVMRSVRQLPTVPAGILDRYSRFAEHVRR